MATKIMLIRHGEKPADDDSVRGVNESGAHDSNELSVRGWQRAGALVRFFCPPGGAFPHASLATPAVIFASGPTDHAKSVRSLHTVQPLAQFLNKTVDSGHDPDDAPQIAKLALAADGVVLISWEHDSLVNITRAILGNHAAAPRKWPDSRFDVVWVLDRSGADWNLTQVPQLLLAGDRAEVIEMVKAGP